MISSPLSIIKKWEGVMDFSKTLELQKQFKPLAKAGQGIFLGFESEEPVITLGLRSDQTHILWPEERLKKNSIKQMKIKRGGEATLHSPGQLVIYPVICLPLIGLKVRDFIVALEEITQRVLGDFGIQTKREGKYAGLYTKKGKICFFGIHISEGVSQHGLSVNMDNDLALFDSIKSCGESGREHDSLSFYPDISISKQDLFFKWCDKAIDFFNDRSSEVLDREHNTSVR